MDSPEVEDQGRLRSKRDKRLGEVAFRNSWLAETDELYTARDFLALRLCVRDYGGNTRLSLCGRARVCSRRMFHVTNRSIRYSSVSKPLRARFAPTRRDDTSARPFCFSPFRVPQSAFRILVCRQQTDEFLSHNKCSLCNVVSPFPVETFQQTTMRVPSIQSRNEDTENGGSPRRRRII